MKKSKNIKYIQVYWLVVGFKAVTGRNWKIHMLSKLKSSLFLLPKPWPDGWSQGESLWNLPNDRQEEKEVESPNQSSGSQVSAPALPKNLSRVGPCALRAFTTEMA